MIRVKEFYKSVNHIGRWLHKPLYILRLSNLEEHKEMTVDEIINILNENKGDYWLLIKGSKYFSPSELPEINELVSRIKNECNIFIMLFQDALKPTKHIIGIDYLELYLKDVTQENLNTIPALHNRIGDTIIYLNSRQHKEILEIVNLHYPLELGLLYALPYEDVTYVTRAVDLTRIAYYLPSSRWSTTVRAYTIFKDGGYFPETLKSLISKIMGKSGNENKSFKRKESLINDTAGNL